MTFLEAVKEVKDKGKKIRPKDPLKPLMFWDTLGFQWRHVEGGVVQLMPSPEELLGEWEAVD